MNIVDEQYSWNTGFQQRLKKKKVIAGRPTPKLAELTELILKFFFELENTSAVIHISKKCANMFLCENRENPLAGRIGSPIKPLRLQRPTGFGQFFCQRILGAPLVWGNSTVIALLEFFEKMM